MRQQLDRYKEMDYTFGSSRECKLLDDLTNDVENMNVDDFTEHVFEYDSISPLEDNDAATCEEDFGRCW